MISVALPIYNGLPHLREALESTLAQDTDLEVVISDDGSADDSVDYVRSVGDPRIHMLLNKSNSGIFGNLNRCLAMCKGEYIQIFCQDDVMHPGYLSSQVSMLTRYGDAGLVYGDARSIDGLGRPGPPGPFDTTPELISKAIYRWIASHYGALPQSLSSVMLPRRTLDRVGLFNEGYRVAGDVEYYHRVAELFPLVRNSSILHSVRGHAGMTSVASTSGEAYLREEAGLHEVLAQWWAPHELSLIDRYRASSRGQQHLSWIVRAALRGEVSKALGSLRRMHRIYPLHWVAAYAIRARVLGLDPIGPLIRAPRRSDA